MSGSFYDPRAILLLLLMLGKISTSTSNVTKDGTKISEKELTNDLYQADNLRNLVGANQSFRKPGFLMNNVYIRR